MTHLKEGDQAPELTLRNAPSKPVLINELKGKKIILYFYPKDDTPGCTAEACNLRDNYSELKQLGFEIIGVSPDTDTLHQKFIGKYQLPFTLIADPDKEIIERYGVWGEKMMFGKKTFGVHRTTFIISEEGIIENIIKKVDTNEHTAQILAILNK